MVKKKTLIGIGLICGTVTLAGLVGFFSLTRVPYTDAVPAAHVESYITDKNMGSTDNFRNGEVTIEILVVAGDFDDVLDPNEPMEVLIMGRNKSWSIPPINLGDSGKTEADYGETIECDGVVEGIEENLYVRMSVPTNSDGDVTDGMTIKIYMWPTTDAVSAVDGNISPASFDNLATYDWWDENDTIDIDITSKVDSLGLYGYDGAYLEGMGIDE